MAYLLDANVFIEARNRYYGMDYCPAFWDWLTRQNEAGAVFSIEQVASELQGHDDELANWAAERASAFFLPLDDAVLASLPMVSEWVARQHYRPAAVREFLEGADYYLVGYAHAHGHVVVTQEVAAAAERKVPIPNVCIGMKTKFMNTFDMLRRERARFVLGAPPPRPAFGRRVLLP